MRFFALFAIRFYQSFLSPLKGFRCSYAVCTGRASCSQLGFRAVRRFGVLHGITITRQRTYLCGVAHRKFFHSRLRPLAHQRGDCDPSCDLPCDSDCDLPAGKSCGKLFDIADCCDCGDCDWGDKKRRNRKAKRERDVHIPARPSHGGKRGLISRSI